MSLRLCNLIMIYAEVGGLPKNLWYWMSSVAGNAKGSFLAGFYEVLKWHSGLAERRESSLILR